MSENKILKMPHHHMKRLGLWSLRELIKPSEWHHEPYAMVDDDIFLTVQELNRWGLKTLYSCEGHEGENPRDEHSVWRYVMFRDKVKGLYPLPDEGREKGRWRWGMEGKGVEWVGDKEEGKRTEKEWLKKIKQIIFDKQKQA